jgi:hypothetical protein
MAKKTKTDYSMTCRCGAKMPIYKIKNEQFFARCFGCGQITFGPFLLLERLRFTDNLCPHHPEPRLCKGGMTTWCPLCRIRCFIYKQKTRAT